MIFKDMRPVSDFGMILSEFDRKEDEKGRWNRVTAKLGYKYIFFLFSLNFLFSDSSPPFCFLTYIYIYIYIIIYNI